ACSVVLVWRRVLGRDAKWRKGSDDDGYFDRSAGGTARRPSTAGISTRRGPYARFRDATVRSKAVHALALALVALCTILLMAPATYHRIAFSGEVTPQLLQLGNEFILAATLALAFGLSADVYLVSARIAGETVGRGTATLSLGMLVGLWHVSPLVLRS